MVNDCRVKLCDVQEALSHEISWNDTIRRTGVLHEDMALLDDDLQYIIYV